MGQAMSYVFRSMGKTFEYTKRFLLVSIVLLGVISIFGYFFQKDRPAVSMSQVYDVQQARLYSPIHDPVFQESDRGKTLLAIYRTVSCGFFGETCTDDPKEAYLYSRSSFFGSISNLMAMPFSKPPASAIVWAQSGLASSGLAPQVQASEGIGFSSIKGFIYVWTAFRNIALMLLVLITIVLGFLIMFRANLDGQTAVSLQSILPRIVLTMLYISFSFAIAGLLIDLMYLLIGVSVDIIWGSGLGLDGETVARTRDEFIGAGMNNLWWVNINPFVVGSAFWDMVPMSFKGLIDLMLFKNLNILVLHGLTYLVNLPIQAVSHVGVNAGAFGFTAGGNVGKLPEFLVWIIQIIGTGILGWVLPGLVLGLIITLTILFFAFKIFFLLLSSYIKIMLYIIFAPIIIIFEVIPGNSSFSWWLKNLAGELIAFPTVIVIMLAGQMINLINDVKGPYWTSLGSGVFSTPPNTFTLPFLYGFLPEDFSVVVALGIILITPDFIKMVKGWLGVQDSGLSFSMGTFFSGATAILGGGLGLATQAGGLQMSVPGLRRYMARIPGMDGIVNTLFNPESGTGKKTP